MGTGHPSGDVHYVGDVAADPNLYNDDLAPVPMDKRTWTGYTIFAMWMSDVHSRRRLHLRRQPLPARPLRLAGAARDDGRHSRRLRADELIGQPSLSATASPSRSWRASRSGVMGANLAARDSRRRRHRLVRRADLLRLEGGGDAASCSSSPSAVALHDTSFLRLDTARLGQLPVHVVLPAR